MVGVESLRVFPATKIKGNLLPSQKDGVVSAPLRHKFFSQQSKINISNIPVGCTLRGPLCFVDDFPNRSLA